MTKTIIIFKIIIYIPRFLDRRRRVPHYVSFGKHCIPCFSGAGITARYKTTGDQQPFTMSIVFGSSVGFPPNDWWWMGSSTTCWMGAQEVAANCVHALSHTSNFAHTHLPILDMKCRLLLIELRCRWALASAVFFHPCGMWNREPPRKAFKFPVIGAVNWFTFVDVVKNRCLISCVTDFCSGWYFLIDVTLNI